MLQPQATEDHLRPEPPPRKQIGPFRYRSFGIIDEIQCTKSFRRQERCGNRGHDRRQAAGGGRRLDLERK